MAADAIIVLIAYMHGPFSSLHHFKQWLMFLYPALAANSVTY